MIAGHARKTRLRIVWYINTLLKSTHYLYLELPNKYFKYALYTYTMQPPHDGPTEEELQAMSEEHVAWLEEQEAAEAAEAAEAQEAA